MKLKKAAATLSSANYIGKNDENGIWNNCDDVKNVVNTVCNGENYTRYF